MGLQVSWSSERHIKRSHDPDRSEAVNLGLVSGSQSSQQSPVMGLGVRNSHESGVTENPRLLAKVKIPRSLGSKE